MSSAGPDRHSGLGTHPGARGFRPGKTHSYPPAAHREQMSSSFWLNVHFICTARSARRPTASEVGRAKAHLEPPTTSARARPFRSRRAVARLVPDGAEARGRVERRVSRLGLDLRGVACAARDASGRTRSRFAFKRVVAGYMLTGVAVGSWEVLGWTSNSVSLSRRQKYMEGCTTDSGARSAWTTGPGGSGTCSGR